MRCRERSREAETMQIGSQARNKLVDRLSAPAGISASMAALVESGRPAPQILARNAAADLVDRAAAVQYPALTVYCDKISNDLREKFRSFSGAVELAIEVRHSQDRLDGLEDALEQYTDAVTQALTATRGDWGDGMFFAGAYQVSFGTVKKGGRNFTQAAKITFEVGVSRS
jgi:hypothetical protein